MNRNILIGIAGAAIALVVAAGAAYAGPASITTAAAQATATAAAQPTAAPGTRANRPRKALRLAQGLIKVTADTTGTTVHDVVVALQGGQSLAGYAQAHGKTADDIIAKLREQGEARLANRLEKAKGLLDKPRLGRGGSPTTTPQAPSE